MRLLDLMNAKRIRQVDLLRETALQGQQIWPGNLSDFVNNKMYRPGYAKRIKEAMRSLGCTDAELATVDEFKPRG